MHHAEVCKSPSQVANVGAVVHRTDVTAPPVPALLINNMAEGLEGRLAPEDAAERERRKKHWKAVSGSAVATWNAMFAGGRAAGARRAQQRGTDFFNRIVRGLPQHLLEGEAHPAAVYLTQCSEVSLPCCADLHI